MIQIRFNKRYTKEAIDYLQEMFSYAREDLYYQQDCFDDSIEVCKDCKYKELCHDLCNVLDYLHKI